MELSIKKKTSQKQFLKLISLFCAYLLWRGINTYHDITLSHTVPVSFYNSSEYLIEAPESITLTIKGKRSALFLPPETLAVHINARHFNEGTHTIEVNRNNLFLPDTLKLISCNPHRFIVTFTKRKDTE